MKQIFTLLLLISLPLFGALPKQFLTDLTAAINNPKLEVKALDKLINTYSNFLSPYSDVSRFSAELKGEKIEEYPLKSLRNKPLYQNNIQKLLKSDNRNLKILGYILITATGDRSFEQKLIQNLKNEKEVPQLMCAIALMYTGSDETTLLFDFLVEHENFQDAHFLKLLTRMDPKKLQQTAYSRMESKNRKAKMLAANLLSETPNNPRTEAALKKAVKEWPIDIKGYAIYSIQKLKIGNMLPILKPFLNDPKIKRIGFQALANSVTQSDRAYVIQAARKNPDREHLDALLQSEQKDLLMVWLELLEAGKVPTGYFFSVYNSKTLKSDHFHRVILKTLNNIKHQEVASNLVMLLRGRTDQKTTSYLLKHLKVKNRSLRYQCALALINNPAPEISRIVPELLKNIRWRTYALTQLAIRNKIDHLQPVYRTLLTEKPDRDTRRGALEYLSTFPKQQDRTLFIDILKEEENDHNTFMKRYAATGLGNLKDQQSVSLLIKTAEHYRKRHDYNVLPYLKPLARIGGKEAKAYIKQFQNSRSQRVAETAKQLLKNWK